jgi:hypothetical protein
MEKYIKWIISGVILLTVSFILNAVFIFNAIKAPAEQRYREMIVFNQTANDMRQAYSKYFTANDKAESIEKAINEATDKTDYTINKILGYHLVTKFTNSTVFQYFDKPLDKIKVNRWYGYSGYFNKNI